MTALITSLGTNVATRHHLPLNRHNVTLGHLHGLMLLLALVCALLSAVLAVIFLADCSWVEAVLTAVLGGCALMT